MRYFIQHIGDDQKFFNKLEKDSRLDRLRQEESKERIILKNGGGIFVVSSQERNSSKSIESAMGLGARIVIGDEYNLTSDNTEATIFRMIAGKGKDAFYCKIGNPFYSNPPYTHFLDSWNNPNYEKVFIDYKQGLKEGRYSEDFIEEAKRKPLFDVLFGCEFPPLDVIDEKGFRPLFIGDIKYGMNPSLLKELIEKEIEKKGELKIPVKLGCDIGGGGDKNVFTARWGKFASVVAENKSNDTMTNVAEIQRCMEEYHIKDTDINVDDIGIGRGVVDRCHELGINVNGVSAGEKATDQETFTNRKAEMCWDMKLWLEDENSRIDERPEWEQVKWLRYKVNSEKRVQIESKDDLKKRTHKSPDYAESLYLTFVDNSFVGFI